MNPTVRARLIVGGVAAVIILVIAFLVTHGPAKTVDEPRAANFYLAPSDVPSQPGRLIRSEPVTTQVPDGMQAWRILYTTTREKGVPAVASALVIVKQDAGSGKHPVIAWAHGTTGITPDCAPSIRMDVTFTSIPGLAKAVGKGWVVVATDYIGLGTVGPHPYLIGQGEGRSVLDSVRAARQFTEVSLSDQTVVWGHSQGGHAALWAGIIEPSYAPDVHLDGIGAVAPAGDVKGVIGNFAKTTAPGLNTIFSAYLVDAYKAAYPDDGIAKYVRSSASDALAGLAGHCLGDISTNDLAEPVFSKKLWATDPTTGKFGKLMEENSPTGQISVPVFIGQGADDKLVLPTTQAAYVGDRCATAGNGPLDYVRYPGDTHISIVGSTSDLPGDLVDWTAARFAGKQAPSTC